MKEFDLILGLPNTKVYGFANYNVWINSSLVFDSQLWIKVRHQLRSQGRNLRVVIRGRKVFLTKDIDMQLGWVTSNACHGGPGLSGCSSKTLSHATYDICWGLSVLVLSQDIKLICFSILDYKILWFWLHFSAIPNRFVCQHPKWNERFWRYREWVCHFTLWQMMAF